MERFVQEGVSGISPETLYHSSQETSLIPEGQIRVGPANLQRKVGLCALATLQVNPGRFSPRTHAGPCHSLCVGFGYPIRREARRRCLSAELSDNGGSHMKPAALVATAFLTVVAVLHVLRLVFQVEVTAGAVVIPMWASVFAVLGTGAQAACFLEE